MGAPVRKTVDGCIDTHAHLYFEQFDEDRAYILSVMTEMGCGSIQVGTKKETTEATSSGCPNLPNMMLFFQEAKTSGLVDFI